MAPLAVDRKHKTGRQRIPSQRAVVTGAAFGEELFEALVDIVRVNAALCRQRLHDHVSLVTVAAVRPAGDSVERIEARVHELARIPLAEVLELLLIHRLSVVPVARLRGRVCSEAADDSTKCTHLGGVGLDSIKGFGEHGVNIGLLCLQRLTGHLGVGALLSGWQSTGDDCFWWRRPNSAPDDGGQHIQTCVEALAHSEIFENVEFNVAVNVVPVSAGIFASELHRYVLAARVACDAHARVFVDVVLDVDELGHVEDHVVLSHITRDQRHSA